jgi:hypothetical protein
MAELPDRCMVCDRELVSRPLFSDNLTDCPMCGRRFCNRCAVRRGGRDFCGLQCGDTFFFGDMEGDTEEDSDVADD